MKLISNKVDIPFLVKDTVWDTVCADRVSARVIHSDRPEQRHGIGHGLDYPCDQPCNATVQPNSHSEIPEKRHGLGHGLGYPCAGPCNLNFQQKHNSDNFRSKTRFSTPPILPV